MQTFTAEAVIGLAISAINLLRQMKGISGKDKEALDIAHSKLLLVNAALESENIDLSQQYIGEQTPE